MTKRAYAVLLFLCFSILPIFASATLITNAGDPLLSGAALIDFSEVPVGTLNPGINGVQFIGHSTALETKDWAFFFHSTDNRPVLSNSTVGTEGTAFDIFFGAAVSAMGIQAHAINSPVVLEAYDLQNQLLNTAAYPTTDRWGVYFLGFGDLPGQIARIRVNTTDGVMFDNLHFVRAGSQVPLPSTAALILLGIVGLKFSKRTFTAPNLSAS